jgi:hypothetical protein
MLMSLPDWTDRDRREALAARQGYDSPPGVRAIAPSPLCEKVGDIQRLLRSLYGQSPIVSRSAGSQAPE